LALYSPSSFYSIATNFPKEGEIILMITAHTMYHKILIVGPYHPNTSASFFEKRIMSRMGLVKFRYSIDKD